MVLAFKRLTLGITDGDFREPEARQEEILTLLHRAWAHYFSQVSMVLMPKTAFTNLVALDRDERVMMGRDSPFFRTPQPTDGAVVSGRDQAVAIFNADCVNVVLVQDEQLALLHCGFRTMISDQPNTPSVIETAMKQFGQDRVHATIWGGAGPCCLQLSDDKREIWNPGVALNHRGLLEDSLGCTTRGPFSNLQRTVDLYKLAGLILQHCGVSPDRIEVDYTCTVCAKRAGKPIYWSHTRYKKQMIDWERKGDLGVPSPVDGRNLSVAWLERELPRPM